MEKSKNYADKSVKVKATTKDALEKIGKGKSIDESINILLDAYSDLKKLQLRFKTLEDEVTALRQTPQSQPAPITIAPQTEISKDSSEITEPPAISESVKVGGQQCDFYTFNDKKQLVECTRTFAEKNEILRVTQQVCDKCWNNIQSKKEQAKEDPALPAPNSPSGVRLESKPSNENEPWTPTEQRAIELAYEKTKAKEKAKAECKMAVLEAKRKLLESQNRLKEEDRKRRDFYRNANRQSQIDMGDSAGIPDELVFRND